MRAVRVGGAGTVDEECTTQPNGICPRSLNDQCCDAGGVFRSGESAFIREGARMTPIAVGGICEKVVQYPRCVYQGCFAVRADPGPCPGCQVRTG